MDGRRINPCKINNSRRACTYIGVYPESNFLFSMGHHVLILILYLHKLGQSFEGNPYIHIGHDHFIILIMGDFRSFATLMALKGNLLIEMFVLFLPCIIPSCIHIHINTKEALGKEHL